MSTDTKYLSDWLKGMDAFNATPGEGITREVYTAEFARAEDYVKKSMTALGLEVSADAVGNIFGRWRGEDATLPEVWTGSHIDSVPHGGSYDGAAGVAAGLAAVRLLMDSGYRPRRTISVNVYAGEEMSRFGKCCIGSRALAGALTAKDMRESVDAHGVTMYDAARAAGLHPERFAEALPLQRSVSAHVELHIEQNDLLEQRGVPVGVVTGICAPTNLRCHVTGEQAHAGGRSMARRRDAFMAAAEMALALESLTRASKSAYITATVGDVRLSPGAANVVPGAADFSVDIRSVSASDKSALVASWRDKAQEIAKRRGVGLTIETLNDDEPYVTDAHINEILCEAATGLHIPFAEVVSGPYHDSLILSRLMPAGMIFIPCAGGVSHSREENINIEDLAKGAEVLAAALKKLAE